MPPEMMLLCNDMAVVATKDMVDAATGDELFKAGNCGTIRSDCDVPTPDGNRAGKWVVFGDSEIRLTIEEVAEHLRAQSLS